MTTLGYRTPTPRWGMAQIRSHFSWKPNDSPRGSSPRLESRNQTWAAPNGAPDAEGHVRRRQGWGDGAGGRGTCLARGRLHGVQQGAAFPRRRRHRVLRHRHRVLRRLVQGRGADHRAVGPGRDENAVARDMGGAVLRARGHQGHDAWHQKARWVRRGAPTPSSTCRQCQCQRSTDVRRLGQASWFRKPGSHARLVLLNCYANWNLIWTTYPTSALAAIELTVYYLEHRVFRAKRT